jgi:hypothetical protein
MEFLTALLDVFPLEEVARDRINELFRHDDHAGDIVPLRHVRPRTPASPQEPAASARGTGARTTGTGRPNPVRPLQVYGSSSNLKIELEDETETNFASSSPRSTHGERKKPAPETIQPKTLIWWIIFVLIGGQLFWWLYARMNQPLP